MRIPSSETVNALSFMTAYLDMMRRKSDRSVKN